MIKLLNVSWPLLIVILLIKLTEFTEASPYDEERFEHMEYLRWKELHDQATVPLRVASSTSTSTKATTRPALPTTTTKPSTTSSSLDNFRRTDSSSNSPMTCGQPFPVANQFKTPGLNGWDLTSQPNYFNNSASVHEHNLNCSWTIARQDSLILLIRISRIMLESSTNCQFDALIFQYVDFNTGLEVHRNFCESADNRFLLSASNVKIQFKTDSSVSYRGFHLQWAFVNESLAAEILNSSRGSQCASLKEAPEANLFNLSSPGGMLLSHEEFTLKPNFTRHAIYQNNLNCSWNIPMKKQYILLYIRFLQLEHASGYPTCNFDNLTLHFYDVISGRPTTLLFCAPIRELAYLSNSSIQVAFRTDSSVGSQGFDIEWLHLNETQAELAWQSVNASVTGNSSKPICTTIEPLSNLTLDGIDALSGGQLVSHPEFLTINTSSYRSNMNCRWTIRNPDNLTMIYFRVLSLELETSSVAYSVCRFDNLTIEYTDILSGRRMVRVACHSLHLAYFTSSSDVSIRFATDSSISSRGFHLLWYFIPQSQAYQLSGLENTISFNCVQANQDKGLLVFSSLQSNTNCLWHWLVNQGKVMNISIRYGSVDNIMTLPTESELPSKACCLPSSLDIRVTYTDVLNERQTHCFCGSGPISLVALAYAGYLDVKVISRTSLNSVGFVMLYTLLDEPVHTDCAKPQVTNRYEMILQDRMSRKQKTSCEWFIQPLDENYGVTIKQTLVDVSELSGQQFSAPGCSCSYEMRTNTSISPETLRNWTLMIQAGSPVDTNVGLRPQTSKICCGISSVTEHRLLTDIPFYNNILRRDFISLGPVRIRINFERHSNPILLAFRILQFPIARPGSSRLCSAKQTVAKRNIIIEEQPDSRMVSVKQVTIKSATDCIGSVLLKPKFNTGPYGFIHSTQTVRVSANCTLTEGQIHIVKKDLSVRAVPCNGEALTTNLPMTVPLTFEANATGGFTLVVELITLITKMGRICESPPTRRTSWKARLPFYSPAPVPFFHRIFFYCTISMTPPAGYELIVDLQTPFRNEYQQQLCSEISSLVEQPKLSFSFYSIRNRETRQLSLCDHDSPGGLGLQDKVRVREDESLTIDLTYLKSGLQNPALGDGLSELQWMNADVDFVVSVTQVQVCERLPGSAEQWQMSKDGAELSRTVTLAPDNTQTNCKLQLDSVAIAQIANRTGVFRTDAARVQCWKLHVELDKFSTTCGVEQLMLTWSQPDVLADSVLHSQREICGSSAINFTTTLSPKAAGSGISIVYSGVRSGFRARFSVSVCPNSGAAIEGLRAGAGSIAPSLIVALVILTVFNLLAVGFMFRARILYAVRLCASGSQRLQQLSYRAAAGTDGVQLIQENT